MAIKVRRSGLVSFAIKIGSTVTGLIFSVLVTRNISTNEFGLWSLISRTVGYVLVPTAIIAFWITRYRARGVNIGWTSLISGLMFTAVLTAVFVTISFPISTSVGQVTSANSNLYFFFLSAPQILLYTVAGSLEALLWGTSPEKMSYGFASFEIAKVITGYVGIVIFHLALAGAILGVIGAQIIQILFLLLFTRGEYSVGPSFLVIKNMVKNGWIALLNNIHPLVISLDFLLVGVITGSTNALALYGVALIFGNVVTYSAAIASGLYPSVLSGKEPSGATNQILELQLIFLFPMALGAIILREQLLNLMNPLYIPGTTILIIVVVASAFASLQSIPDSVIAGSDTTDTNEKASLASYVKSKLFLLSKINLGLAFAYLVGVSISAYIFNVPSPSTASVNQYVTLGMFWAFSSLGMSLAGFILKTKYILSMIKVRVDPNLLGALVVSSSLYGITLYYVSMLLPPVGGEISEAARIFAIGIISLVVYGVIMYGLSQVMRNLVKAVIKTFFSSVF